MKKIICLAVALCLAVCLFACGETKTDPTPTPTAAPTAMPPTTEPTPTADPTVLPTEIPENAIVFSDSGATGAGTIEGTVVTITAGGTYTVTGNCANGQIVVNAPDEKVTLVLSGLSLTCTTSAPLYLMDADKLTLELVGDNRLADTDRSGEKPKGAMQLKEDTKITGNGKLTVTGKNVSALRCDGDLKIENCTLVLSSPDDTLTCEGELTLNANINVTSEAGDGIKTSIYNPEKEKKGNLLIEGGTVVTVTGGDGIQAERDLSIGGGASVTVTAGGGHTEPDNDASKGIKANGRLEIRGSTVVIDARCDGLSSGGEAKDKDDNPYTLAGGMLLSESQITVKTGVDGVQSDAEIVISGCTLTVEAGNAGNFAAEIKERGVKADGAVTITDSTLDIAAYFDGINAAGVLTVSGGTASVWSRGKNPLQSDESILLNKGAKITAYGKSAKKVAMPPNMTLEDGATFDGQIKEN